MDDAVDTASDSSSEPDAPPPQAENPTLDPVEVRVLGVLIEKSATTPDQYPLTLNSLRNGCNQSSSRDPVVDYDEAIIETALNSLRARGLIRIVHSRSNRGAKYRHVADEVYELTPSELAVLDVLMLRGPQTVGQLKQRAERQHAFDDLDTTERCLNDLAGRHLAQQLPRQRGQNEARWVQLLSGEPPADGSDHPTSSPPEQHTSQHFVAASDHPIADPHVLSPSAAGTSTPTRQSAHVGNELERTFGSCSAVRVGSSIHIAGVTASGAAATGDAATQTANILEIIELLLAELGASMGDIVHTTVWVVQGADETSVAQSHRDALGDIVPATTLVGVASVGGEPSCLVQIGAIAVT